MDDSKPPTVDDRPSRDRGPADDSAGIERYKLGEVIGRGGMGEVIAAHDLQIGRTVAIKRLRRERAGDAAIKRFVREARVQGRLEHPAIVPVHEVSRDAEGRPYFVMKQVTGVTLSTALREGAPPPFTRQRLLRAFVDACLAVEFAHRRGVLHRDLKPSNIMLGDFGETYVLDWGLAHLGDREPEPPTPPPDDEAPLVTAAGLVLGTPGYISPEQLRGELPLDGRADVYALGCMLFEILTGQRMLETAAQEPALALVPRDGRPSVRAPERDIPPELDLVCVRAMALERDERFATARELADAVQRFLDGDRDLVLRQRLARDELDAANAALASDSPGSRPAAIRAAARALALDPSAKEAAVLVARLMLEPPSETPSEVVAELARRDVEDLRLEARFGLTAGLAYLAFIPLLYWVGFREAWLYGGFAGAAALIAYAELVIVRSDAQLSGRITLVCHLILLALLAAVASPYLIGPGPACVLVMLLATQPAVAPTWLVALGALAVTLAPLALERVGLVSNHLTASGSHLTVRLMAETLDAQASAFTLTCYCAALIALAMLMGRAQDDERRRSRTALAIQSWQLRQLLPR